MTHTVGPKGQVVIPKELRERFSIRPGDRVRFWDCEDHVALGPAQNPQSLRGRYRGAGLSQILEEERRAEREREPRR